MSSSDLGRPNASEWLGFGITVGTEVHAGNQSRVFDAVVAGKRTAVKLTDGRLSSRGLLLERMRAVEALGSRSPEVIAPLRIDGEVVQPIGEWLMTATPFVEGRRLDISQAVDARWMGRSLARLHVALALLPDYSIPPVAALQVPDDGTDRSGWQLLHGDFSDQNTIATEAGLRIFDFDDCGYGPIEYDLANSLYMVLFDATVNDRLDRYEAFRPPFLAGYAESADPGVDHHALDAMIDTRIGALARWLDDLPNAPIGIQMSSPSWRRTLAEFVISHGSAATPHLG